MPCSDTSSKTSMVLTVEEWPLVLQGHCALHACRHDPRRPVCQRLGAREGCPSAAILALVLEAIATFVPASAIVAACSYLASRTLLSILTLGMMAPISSITTSLLQGPIWLTCTLSKQFCW